MNKNQIVLFLESLEGKTIEKVEAELHFTGEAENYFQSILITIDRKKILIYSVTFDRGDQDAVVVEIN